MRCSLASANKNRIKSHQPWTKKGGQVTAGATVGTSQLACDCCGSVRGRSLCLPPYCPETLRCEGKCRFRCLRDGDVMSYIVTYLLPFLAVKLNDPTDLISIGIVFIVIGLLYVNSNMIHTNPVINIGGVPHLRNRRRQRQDDGSDMQTHLYPNEFRDQRDFPRRLRFTGEEIMPPQEAIQSRPQAFAGNPAVNVLVAAEPGADVILQRLNLRQDLAAEFLAAAQAVRPDEVVVLGLMSQVIHRTGTSFVTSTSRRMTQSRN